MIDSKLIGVSGDITNFIPRVQTLENHSVLSTRDSRGGVSFSSWKSTIKMINSNSEQSHLRWVAWDAQWRQTIGRVAVGCCFSLGEITKKYPVLQLRTPYRPTQSVMYVPLQVNEYISRKYFTYRPVQIFKIMFRRFLFSRIWSPAQDHAVLLLLLNLVGFFISTRPRWSGGNDLYHSCTSYEGASRGGQPLNIFTWFTGAGGGQKTLASTQLKKARTNETVTKVIERCRYTQTLTT